MPPGSPSTWQSSYATATPHMETLILPAESWYALCQQWPFRFIPALWSPRVDCHVAGPVRRSAPDRLLAMTRVVLSHNRFIAEQTGGFSEAPAAQERRTQNTWKIKGLSTSSRLRRGDSLLEGRSPPKAGGRPKNLADHSPRSIRPRDPSLRSGAARRSG